MPNTVTNRLFISGKPKKIKSFLKHNITKNNLDLNLSVPVIVPVGGQGNYEDKYGMAIWMDNWGSLGIEKNSTELGNLNGVQYIDFWSLSMPPINWLRKVAEQWPTLKFTLVWYELNMNHYGVYKIAHADYEINKEYKGSGDDFIYYDENDKVLSEKEDWRAETQRAGGRFKKMLDKYGMEYEATMG